MLDFLCLCIKYKFIIKTNIALGSNLNSEKYGSTGAKKNKKKRNNTRLLQKVVVLFILEFYLMFGSLRFKPAI
jgi:hypothetical protein